MKKTVQEILAIEETLSEKVRRCGVQAGCQENAFSALRPGLLQAWSPELLENCRGDLLAAQTEGRNLLCEQLAYRLTCLDPEKYAVLKRGLPMTSMEKLWLTDLICAASLSWLEALRGRYPHLTGRLLHKDWDAAFLEACLQGELLSYSVETLRCYAALVDRHQRESVNLWEQAMENTVVQEGFPNLESAESRWRKAM